MGEIGLLTSADIDLGYRASSMSVVELVMFCVGCLEHVSAVGRETAQRKKCVALI
jgi:hypothetical protein